MNKLFNASIKRTASEKELICFTSKGSDLSPSFDPLGPFLEHDDKLWRQLCTIAVSQWMLTVNRGNDCPVRVGMLWISTACGGFDTNQRHSHKRTCVMYMVLRKQ